MSTARTAEDGAGRGTGSLTEPEPSPDAQLRYDVAAPASVRAAVGFGRPIAVVPAARD